MNFGYVTYNQIFFKLLSVVNTKDGLLKGSMKDKIHLLKGWLLMMMNIKILTLTRKRLYLYILKINENIGR